LRDPRLAGHRFAVIGHTDATGKTAANLRLSSRRARAVVDYLRTEGSIDGARLIAWGRGEDNLKFPDQPDSLSNRRMLIVNAGRMTADKPGAPAVAAPTTVYSNSAAGGPLLGDGPRSVPGAQSTIEHGRGDNSECRRYLPSANRVVPCNY
jgi:hypothetical protein